MEIKINGTVISLKDVVLVTSILEGNAFPYFLIKYRGGKSKYMGPDGTIQKYEGKVKGGDFQDDCDKELNIIRNFVLKYWGTDPKEDIDFSETDKMFI